MSWTVGVNLLWLRPGQVGGSETYLTRLITAIGETERGGIDLELFARPGLTDAHPEVARRHRVRVVPVGRTRPMRVAAEAMWLRRAAAGLDLMHHAGGTVPVGYNAASVVTVHDLQYLDHPEYFSRVKRSYLSSMVPQAVRRCRLVVVPSPLVAERAQQAFRLSPESVAVVPHGIAPLPVDSGFDTPPDPYVLMPAITHPHKNHAVVLRALARLRAAGSEVTLVTTSGPGRGESGFVESVRRLGLEDGVRRFGWLDPGQLGALYAGAAALVWPSLYEGFGAPVVEAMTMGCPVVAADAPMSTASWLLGESGMLLEPDDDVAWADAIQSVIADQDLRTRLIDSGARRATDFSPERAAQAQLAAYRRALVRV